ncbi:MBL fold metallo-hydrolase [Craurococcus roseus]|uniref:MBL fold metallo-hydrolase n=1 Tax=Craurococcus roseus TaxID=77585 RepID=A0ABN1FC10_9PROT
MVSERRSFILAATTALAAPALVRGASAQQQQPAASAAAPPAAPKFHKMTVGSLPVAIVQDGSNRRADATQGFVPGVSAESVSAALAAAGTPGPGLDNPYNQTAVQTRAGLVLLDTGFGQGAPPGTGQMPAAMRAAGYDPAAVRTVVISHFHGDHVGGLLAPDGTPAFPNAAIKVPEAEWTFWNDTGEEARASEARKPGFANARRRFAPYADKVERFRPGAEVAPGVTALDTRGHSPGHVSFLIADGAAQCLVIGDAITTPALFMANPEWYPMFDMDPAQAVETRKKLLERAATERMTVVGYHFPFPATGRVEKAGTGYRLVPSGA